MKRAVTIALMLLFTLLLGYSHAATGQAPPFALLNNNDIMVSRSDLKGNLIIAFFASYCKPCRKEVPALVGLEKKYGGDKKLTLVLIATDVNDQDGEAKDKADRFLKQIGVEHEFLLDIYQMALSQYNPKKDVPATFLVNRYGYIVFSETGVRNDTIDRLEQAIIALKR